MLVILAAKSSLLANVHGSTVVAANPVKVKEDKKACNKLSMLIKAREREGREHLHMHQFLSLDLVYQLKIVKVSF